MTLLTDEIRSFVGLEGDPVTATDPVEPGAVRRFAQAIMDEQPRYGAATEGDERSAIAPALYPQFMFRRPLGSDDPLSAHAGDAYFDGLSLVVNTGLPDLPLPGLGLLNGGAEIEFFRHARHGEKVVQRSQYQDIQEKMSSKGPMLVVIVETEYRTAAGELLLRVRQTNLRR
jgi:hypothetical protein